ncbi:MAG: IS110 family transposase [bacterium]
MYYTGCDVHKRRCTLQHMDSDGALGLNKTVSTTPGDLSGFLDKLNAPTIVTLEASCGYWWLSQFFMSHPKVADVHVVDPRRSKKIAEELSVLAGYGRASNDDIDAEMLAELERMGLAPAIHLPTAEQLEMRTYNRHRLDFVQIKTLASNRIHGKLMLHGPHIIGISKLMNNADSRNKLFQKLPGYVRFTIEDLMALITFCEQKIQRCEAELEKLLPESHPEIKRIMSAPGFGPVFSRTVYTEILDINYFKGDPKYLISYAGLAPIHQDSDGKKKGVIKLNRHCNYYLKYAFVSAAHGARKNPHFRRKYEYDVKKQGKIIAKINLARRLAKSIYWMLIRQQPFKF